ncbi:MAG: hypothetical protein ACE5DN_05755, partial [Flavobacteriales bacterium]
MFIRALTGGMLLTVMIFSIWMHLYSALALFLLIGIASLFEFYGLLSKGGYSVNYVLGISTSLAIYCCAYLATLKI